MSTLDKLLFANWIVSGLGLIVFTMMDAPWPIMIWMGIVFIIGLAATMQRINDLRKQQQSDMSS